ncbi:MAG: ribbon-helix-helix protein, CopG family [Candidatus Helarchaeota archaeon]
MPVPIRITIALDEKTTEFLTKMKNELGSSQSEIIRRALKFFYKYKDIFKQIHDEQLLTYLDMLLNGEHVILDIDHWLSMLKLVNDNEEFWKIHEEISIAHSESLSKQLKTPIKLLKRLEYGNFYSLYIEDSNNYVLVLGSDIPKKFLKIFLERVITAMGYKITIKEGISKLMLNIEKI